MRDPKRIQEILVELEKYWETPGNGDMRLGQIIVRFLPTLYKNDPFYFEDQELLDLLKEANNKD